MDQLTREVRALDVQVTASEESRAKELEHFVSYKAFLLMLAGLLSLNLVAMGWQGAQVEKMAATMRQDNAEARREQAAWRDAWDKRLEWVLQKIDGSSHFKEDKPHKGRK